MWKAWMAACLVAAWSLAGWAQSPADLQRQQQTAEIDRMVAARDYAGIERRMAGDLAAQARFADGMWRTSLAYSDLELALKKRIRTDNDWDATLHRIAALARREPQAWLMFSSAASTRAWTIRGPGFASEVKPEAWLGFHRYIALATKVLDQYRPALAANPSWYSHRIRMSLESGEEIAAAQRLFEEGTARHPRYHATYYAMMRRVSPQWGGNRAREMDLLDQVARLPADSRAEGMYSRLVDYAEQSGFGLIHDPRIDKAALRASIDAIAATYPDLTNVQPLFFMACELSDRPQALSLVPKLGGAPLGQVWPHMVPLFDTCKDWAEGRLPMFIMRDHVDGKVEEYLIR